MNPQAVAPTQPAPMVELPGIASLLDQLDRRVLIILRDGRNLVGVLRSFDQFMNLVLEDTHDRVITGDQYSDFELGFCIVRGDDIVVLGEIDDFKEQHEMPLTLVPNETILSVDQEMTSERLVWDFES